MGSFDQPSLILAVWAALSEYTILDRLPGHYQSKKTCARELRFVASAARTRRCHENLNSNNV